MYITYEYVHMANICKWRMDFFIMADAANWTLSLDTMVIFLCVYGMKTFVYIGLSIAIILGLILWMSKQNEGYCRIEYSNDAIPVPSTTDMKDFVHGQNIFHACTHKKA